MDTPNSAQPQWYQFKLTVEADLVDAVTALFESFAASAITTENAGEDEFYEIAFPGTPTWETVRITALFEGSADIETIRTVTLEALRKNNILEVPNTLEHLDDQDWQRIWLDSFSPIQVGHNLWVVPSWCEPLDSAARNIVLDPGLAFGTGTHATTFMCLDWISRQSLHGSKTLDYGSGSGILAIATIMSGADLSDAVDIDPLAVDACKQNAQRNVHNNKVLTEQINAYLPTELPNDNAPYDLVIANILAEVILQLSDLLSKAVAPSGRILLTGILRTQSGRVMDAFAAEFDFEVQEKDHWVLLIGHKK